MPARNDPTTSSAGSGRWFAFFSLLVDPLRLLFARNPFVYWFFLASGHFLILYAVAIVMAKGVQSSWVDYWIRLSSPFVEGMRWNIPGFINFEHMLLAKGFGSRLDIISHILAVELAISILLLVVMSAAIFSLRHEDWTRLRKAVSTVRLGLALAISVLFFVFFTAWIILGFGLIGNAPIWTSGKQDMSFIVLAPVFVATVTLALSVQVTVYAFLHRRSSDDSVGV